MCDDRTDPCHIAGVGRFCATTATTAAKTRRHAAAAETCRRAAAAETRRRAIQTGRDRSGACGRRATHLARPVRRLGRLYRHSPPRPGATSAGPRPAAPKAERHTRHGQNADPPALSAPPRPRRKGKDGGAVNHRYPVKAKSDPPAEVGTAKFAMYTQDDGAWI